MTTFNAALFLIFCILEGRKLSLETANFDQIIAIRDPGSRDTRKQFASLSLSLSNFNGDQLLFVSFVDGYSLAILTSYVSGRFYNLDTN